MLTNVLQYSESIKFCCPTNMSTKCQNCKKTVIVDCFVYIFGISCTGFDIRRYHFLSSFISSQTVGQSIF